MASNAFKEKLKRMSLPKLVLSLTYIIHGSSFPPAIGIVIANPLILFFKAILVCRSETTGADTLLTLKKITLYLNTNDRIVQFRVQFSLQTNTVYIKILSTEFFVENREATVNI